jgi:hypothetical protein
MGGISAFARNGLHRVKALRELRRQESFFTRASENVLGSRALCGISPAPSETASLNAVLPELKAEGIFAGLRTALEFACLLSERGNFDLRLIILKNSLDRRAQNALRQYLSAEFGYTRPVTFSSAEEMNAVVVGSNDHWVATHWTTAHAIDIACRLGLIDKRRVIYLIQDYEPGFHAWSTEFALARSTYLAGFVHVVNSVPLQKYLISEERLHVPHDFVFRPQIDLNRARLAVEGRHPTATPTIFFYGRPSKPRNLFRIGVSTLRIVAEELEKRGIDAKFISAGERHANVPLGKRHQLRSLGKLSWDDYFATLANSDVSLSLQHSPHPSHIPLDAIASGSFAVTNELRGTRAGLHDRLLVGEAEPAALAAQVLEALARSSREGNAGFDARFVESFGATLVEVVNNVVALIRDEDKRTLADTAEDGVN